jgi:hypothetical protein
VWLEIRRLLSAICAFFAKRFGIFTALSGLLFTATGFGAIGTAFGFGGGVATRLSAFGTAFGFGGGVATRLSAIGTAFAGCCTGEKGKRKCRKDKGEVFHVS